jgi:hypothetical protein
MSQGAIAKPKQESPAKGQRPPVKIASEIDHRRSSSGKGRRQPRRSKKRKESTSRSIVLKYIAAEANPKLPATLENLRIMRRP